MRIGIAVVVLLMFCAAVRAQTLTECGRSDGYAYYFTGGLVAADKGGWKKDGIDGGRIILNYINGEIDLLIKDVSGTTRSVKQDGGKIIPRKTNNGLIALTVFYNEGAVSEDYVIQINDRGEGTVASTRMVTARNVNKMSLMTAQCRGPSDWAVPSPR
jgi:hypothetical protein